jgi:anaerobic magnesium-protoporphyrin IX monomethyl ester cyclase
MVLLVTPNSKLINYGLTSSEFSAVQPNIYMHLLESVYNNVKKIPCRSIHMEADGFTNLMLVQYIKKMKPTEVGIICSGSNPSASTMTMVGAIEICKFIKKHLPQQKMFIWGGHPTVMPERTKLETGVDRVIVGDDFGTEPCNIPMVNWEKIDPSKYKAHNWHCFGPDINNRGPYAVIWTTLGCPYQCEFCCINNVFEKRVYKMRNMKDVIAEVDYLVKTHQIKHLKIMDELFVSKNHKRLNEFCDALIERKYGLNIWAFARTDCVNPEILSKLKKAGVNWLAYGFESVNQTSVDAQRKGSKVEEYEKVIRWTKEAGISIIADFIAGFWEDDWNTLQATYDFMCKMNFEFINYYPLFIYPGTPLYDRYLKNGWRPEPKTWDEYSLYGYNCKPVDTKHLKGWEVLKWRDDKYVEYYKRPEYLEMIESKFGKETRDHVFNMASTHLKREAYGHQSSNVV